MKVLLFVLLVVFWGNISAQDWSITTTKLTKWMPSKIEPDDSNHIIFHTTTITKKGNTITFSYNGENQVVTFSYVDQYPITGNGFRAGEKPDFDDRDGECYCYRTAGFGDIIYFYKKKKVMRFYPMQYKYIYFN